MVRLENKDLIICSAQKIYFTYKDTDRMKAKV